MFENSRTSRVTVRRIDRGPLGQILPQVACVFSERFGKILLLSSLKNGRKIFV